MSNKVTVAKIAKMIDHLLMHPTLTEQELKDGCELSKKYNVTSVCVKPYHTKLAKEYLKGSDVLVGAVIGFPHSDIDAILRLREYGFTRIGTGTTENIIKDAEHMSIEG